MLWQCNPNPTNSGKEEYLLLYYNFTCERLLFLFVCLFVSLICASGSSYTNVLEVTYKYQSFLPSAQSLITERVMFSLLSSSINLFLWCTLVASLLPFYFNFVSGGAMTLLYLVLTSSYGFWMHIFSLWLSVCFCLDSFRAVFHYLNWLSCAKVVNPFRASARVHWKWEQWAAWLQRSVIKCFSSAQLFVVHVSS